MSRFFSIIHLGLILFLAHDSSAQNELRSYKRIVKRAPFDAIIVPGFPYKQAKDSILLNVRLYWAKELYDRGVARNIIFSGAAVHTAYNEGMIMKIMADSLGIPSNHTFVEGHALHTTSNAKLGKRLARKLGFKKIAAATDPYQYSYMKLLMWFSAPGVPILTFPRDSMLAYFKPLPVVNPRDAFVKDFVPLKER